METKAWEICGRSKIETKYNIPEAERGKIVGEEVLLRGRERKIGRSSIIAAREDRIKDHFTTEAGAGAEEVWEEIREDYIDDWYSPFFFRVGVCFAFNSRHTPPQLRVHSLEDMPVTGTEWQTQKFVKWERVDLATNSFLELPGRARKSARN